MPKQYQLRGNLPLTRTGTGEDPNLRNIRRWKELGSALWSGLVTEPLSAMAEAGDVIRMKKVGTPELAVRATLAGQGIAHGFGAGGTGPAAIGRRLALKKIDKAYTGYLNKPGRTSLEKLLAKENKNLMKEQIKFLPQEQLDNIEDLKIKNLQRKIGTTTHGYFDPESGNVFLDPLYQGPMTATHEGIHSSQFFTKGLTPENQARSKIMTNIQENLKQAVIDKKIPYKDYEKLYFSKQIPHEVHAERMTENMFDQIVNQTGHVGLASQLSNVAYNKIYEDSIMPVMKALQETAPKTYRKAVLQTRNEMLSNKLKKK